VSVVNSFRGRIWLARHSFSDGWPVLTVAFAALALVVASFCFMVLTWVGAGNVFNKNHRGHPANPNNRYSDYPFVAVVSQLSLLINDTSFLDCI
jgi:hypothetical protein